jgi:hypothetical protein
LLSPLWLISSGQQKTEILALYWMTWANELFLLKQVTRVAKSIGEHTIDLRVETIVKDNYEILDLLEKLKGYRWEYAMRRGARL